ncbi:hypothetical protein ACQ4PT_025423 [Festuca glaucescens]
MADSIATQHAQLRVRRFATSRLEVDGALVGIDDKEEQQEQDATTALASIVVHNIEVRLPNNRRVIGILKYCNLCYNIAIVDIMESRSHRGMKLQGHKPASNGMDIVAVGCLFEERTLMVTKGNVIDKNTDWQHIPSYSELSFSTCKISKAGIGGPLIDTLGNIVGMNFYHEECTPFLSSSIILGLLENDFSKDICAKWSNTIEEEQLQMANCDEEGPAESSPSSSTSTTIAAMRYLFCLLKTGQHRHGQLSNSTRKYSAVRKRNGKHHINIGITIYRH